MTPFLSHSFMVFGTDVADAMGSGHVGKDVLARNVAPRLKERVTQLETHGFADTVTVAVGGRRKSQRGQ